jgi:hypothetical protein
MPKPIPYSFVLDMLDRLDPMVRPMFGCHAIYIGPKMIFIMRKKGKDHDDGVWIATNPEYHGSLKKEFPSLRKIELFGGVETAWQNLPEEADDFESSVIKACELVLMGDERIGKIPKPKSKKKKSAAAKKKTAVKKTAKKQTTVKKKTAAKKKAK